MSQHADEAVFPAQGQHEQDGDCAGQVDQETDTCAGCGVLHGDECPECGARAYHRPGCPESDDAASAVLPTEEDWRRTCQGCDAEYREDARSMLAFLALPAPNGRRGEVGGLIWRNCCGATYCVEPAVVQRVLGAVPR